MNLLVQLVRHIQFLFIALLLASFAVVQSAQAIGPEPSEDDLIVKMTEEDDAVAQLGSDVEALLAQGANNPNRRVLPIKIEKSLQCAGGKVILSGNVVVTFTQPKVGYVLNHSLKFQGFKGTAVAGNRKLQATEKDLKFESYVDYGKDNGVGSGKFGFQFIVTGPELPGGKPLRFKVTYHANRWTWMQGKVTSLVWDKPEVSCRGL